MINLNFCCYYLVYQHPFVQRDEFHHNILQCFSLIFLQNSWWRSKRDRIYEKRPRWVLNSKFLVDESMYIKMARDD